MTAAVGRPAEKDPRGRCYLVRARREARIVETYTLRVRAGNEAGAMDQVPGLLSWSTEELKDLGLIGEVDVARTDRALSIEIVADDHPDLVPESVAMCQREILQ